VNRRQRLREAIQVCHGLVVARDWMPPDWREWGYCPDCAATTGQPCYDVIGTTRTQRATARSGPHMARLPVFLEDPDA
jgi:hypothetical protein